MKRRRYIVKGVVQGVGFRPFVYRLANQLGLSGWVNNTNEGVVIEAEGSSEAHSTFLIHLDKDKPAIASILEINTRDLPVRHETGFDIRESEASAKPNTIVLPDLATCKECLEEVMLPKNRRYRYPFTNCTHCGPRYSIIKRLPYDRKQTTMKHFVMCSQCEAEYHDPNDRRFHAQPNACPSCGPQLALWDAKGSVLAVKEDALSLACELISKGAIVAIKGIGGFQLIVDAENEESIAKLRSRKRREHKPFALMYPHLDLVKEQCEVSHAEEELLTSPQAPIALLKAKSSPSPNIAPDNPYLGVMLPCSPLYHLLLNELGQAVIATSGNRAEEPICIDENEVVDALEGIADYFLVHDRPIVQPVDDSIVRITAERQLVIRRARGYASLPIAIDHPLPPSLAVGAQMKNTVAVGRGNAIYLSQHLGDLESKKAYEGFTSAIQRSLDFYEMEPEIVVSDCHPEYRSTKYAAALNATHQQCQHHIAHVYACMAEHQIDPPLLGISWDGTGYGLDQTVWGGEFFHVKHDFTVERIATLRQFPLLCGEKAIREPRLSAIGMLYEIFQLDLFKQKELYPIQALSEMEERNLKKILTSGFQSPKCSSMGRVFDAVCSLLGLYQKISFEGQAAMKLEFLSEQCQTADFYPFRLVDQQKVDWEPMMRQLITDWQSSVPEEEIAAKFHNTLVEMIVQVAGISEQKRVLLTGGVFQNKVLTEKSVRMLKNKGFEPYWHQDIPPNDGGIAVGQLYSLIKGSHVLGNTGKS